MNLRGTGYYIEMIANYFKMVSNTAVFVVEVGEILIELRKGLRELERKLDSDVHLVAVYGGDVSAKHDWDWVVSIVAN